MPLGSFPLVSGSLLSALISLARSCWGVCGTLFYSFHVQAVNFINCFRLHFLEIINFASILQALKAVMQKPEGFSA